MHKGYYKIQIWGSLHCLPISKSHMTHGSTMARCPCTNVTKKWRLLLRNLSARCPPPSTANRHHCVVAVHRLLWAMEWGVRPLQRLGGSAAWRRGCSFHLHQITWLQHQVPTLKTSPAAVAQPDHAAFTHRWQIGSAIRNLHKCQCNFLPAEISSEFYGQCNY